MRILVPLLALALLLTVVPSSSQARPDGDPRPHGRSDATALSVVEGNATLVVVVNSTGGDGTFSFEATGAGLPSSFSLTTVNGTSQTSFSGLPSEERPSLSEQPPGGWALRASGCDAGTPDNITLQDNGTTTCWFDNVHFATLTVNVTSEGGDGTFAFEASGGGLPASFNVTTVNGSAWVVFANVTPDENVSVREIVPDDWDLANATCEGNLSLEAE